MSQCRFCHATIKFVTLDSGKPIPVEPLPFPDRGNVAAHKTSDGRLVGHVISRDKPLKPGQDRYVPHHANCKSEKPRVTAADRTPTLFDRNPVPASSTLFDPGAA